MPFGHRQGVRQRLGLDEGKGGESAMSKKLCEDYAVGKLTAASLGAYAAAGSASSSDPGADLVLGGNTYTPSMLPATQQHQLQQQHQQH